MELITEKTCYLCHKFHLGHYLTKHVT